MNGQPIEGMVVGHTGQYAVMVDERNGHYGWLFYRHQDGGWVSARKALPEELAGAKDQYRWENVFKAGETAGPVAKVAGGPATAPSEPTPQQETLTALLLDIRNAAAFEQECDNSPDEARETGARRDSDEWNRKALKALQQHLVDHPFLCEGF